MLAELPSPVTGGTILTVEDLQQELKCNITITHRFFSFTLFLLLVLIRASFDILHRKL